MSNKKLILKVDNQCGQHTKHLNKLTGTIDLLNIAKLINSVGLTANPRKSKVCTQTDQIMETLQFNPKMFRFFSKGLLLSSSNCYELERNRVNLTFEDPDYEGICDGGHTTLAIGLFILESVLQIKTKGIKKWDEFHKLWTEVMNEKMFSKLEKAIKFDETGRFKVEIPVDINYPTETGEPFFESNIYQISDARNNNTALSETTKANHKHYYDLLKNQVDSVINEKVMWVDNDSTAQGKTLKVNEILSLALIPMIPLQKKELLPKNVEKINPIYIYSSKGKCVKIFNNIISEASEDYKDQGYKEMLNKIKVNKFLMSAFEMMSIIPDLDDFMYKSFPDFYNATNKRFMTLDSVKKYSTTEKGPNITRKKKYTDFTGVEVEFNYPKGHYLPILSSIHVLMEVTKEGVKWKTDPRKFLEKNLPVIMSSYIKQMESQDFNPQKIGKTQSVYDFVEAKFELLLLKG